ncbi:MAG: DUF2993 domain-containing protein [Armatimonadetes bacterium]|nr:DUF2993 domain-containing protein [Armatimonadota bacterium]
MFKTVKKFSACRIASGRLLGGILPFALIGFALLSGCDQLNPYKIGERSVTRYMKDLMGPAERYNVKIYKKGSDLRRGYISHLTITADDLRTKKGFDIRRLDADLYDVRFNSKSRTLENIGSSAFTAYVTEESANAYLAKNDRGIPGLRVQFETGNIVVNAAPQLLGVSIPLTLRGKGVPQEGNRVHFAPDALAVSRLNLPLMAVRLVEQRINPVFDLDELELPARLQSVESQANEIVLKGEVKLPQ